MREEHPAPTRRQWLIAAGLVIALCAARLWDLGADAPPWLAPGGDGEYVDEGYKTLSPRNLVLFGAEHWHPLDDYPGWMETSPLTSWPYYAAFRWFGPRLESARAVTLLYFALFLSAYLGFAVRRYSFALALAGLLLLGADGVLFFFSRLALFEVPLIAFVYAALFALERWGERTPARAIAAVGALSLTAAFGIKLSALVYTAPIFAALLLRAALRRRRSPGPLLAAGAAAALAAAVLLFATRTAWQDRIAFNAVGYICTLLGNPLNFLSPFLVLGGWLCAAHLLLCRADRVLESAYRSALIGVALLTPLLLALFPLDPPRYYVPVLPAYALLVLEWFHAGAPRAAGARAHGALAAAAGLALGYWWFSLVRVGDYFLLAQLPLGETPGLSALGLRCLALPPALGLAAAVWTLRGRFLAGKRVLPVVAACLCAFALHASLGLASWAWAPPHQGSEVRAALLEHVPRESAIIGDWAPFFALGTPLRVLFMNRYFNVVERVTELHPDYFVYSDSFNANASLADFWQLRGARLGPALFTSEYAGRIVALYPIDYSASEDSSGDEARPLPPPPEPAPDPASLMCAARADTQP